MFDNFLFLIYYNFGDSYCSYQIETQNQTTQNERLADQ